MSKKNIVVIGLGGVGGYFGFKITRRMKRQTIQYKLCSQRTTYEIVKKGLHYFLRSMKTQLQDQMI
jgi:2-dehydropantoate 2-reductase